MPPENQQQIIDNFQYNYIIVQTKRYNGVYRENIEIR